MYMRSSCSRPAGTLYWTDGHLVALLLVLLLQVLLHPPGVQAKHRVRSYHADGGVVCTRGGGTPTVFNRCRFPVEEHLREAAVDQDVDLWRLPKARSQAVLVRCHLDGPA